MIHLLVDRIRSRVAFKQTLNIGDLILTNCGEMPIYALVSDIRHNVDREAPGKWWDIDLILLFLPPIKRRVTLNTEQLAGREQWITNGSERVFVPLDLDSIGKRQPKLRLVKAN